MAGTGVGIGGWFITLPDRENMKDFKYSLPTIIYRVLNEFDFI